MPIIIHPEIIEKLKTLHGVSEREVHQCFDNMEREAILDKREKHKTNPPTQWLISQTNKSRELKVVFMQFGADIIVKSAFEPIPEERRIYFKYAQLLS